jgi:2-(1,2-epoxy-1,2-dihydrophenyl)acetyl-CoA isomerase
MSPQTLRVEIANGVGRIGLDRPGKRNALDGRMARELEATLRDLEGRREVRAVLIRGVGGHFCSGGDLTPEPDAEPPTGSPAGITLDVLNRVYGSAILTLHHFPKPVVAFVEGVAAGAGANLAFACDLVYATPEARFCEIFVRRALSLDCGGSWLLPRLVGMQKAKEIAFFGDWIDAREAASLGLVNAVFESAVAEAEVDAKLARLAEGAPIALALIKQSLHRSASVTMAEALEVEAVAQAACAATEDGAEGMTAFLEKREPRFEGR